METKPQTATQEPAYIPPDEADAVAEEPSAGPGLRENTIVPATVVRLDDGAALVSFGWKSEGRVPFADFAKVDGQPAVKPGDAFEVLVESLGDGPGQTVLSKDKAEKLRRFEQVAARCANGGPVEGTVVARVTGGYSVDIGLRAFLPSAQADLRRLDDPEALVGGTFTFGVAEFDKRRGNIVLTRRKLLEKELKERRRETLAKLAEGAVLPGTVKTLTDYGAFVDLGGVDGLLHVSDMSWGRVNHPKDLLSPGQELTVKVLKYDAAAGKIGLGLKQLQEDPWQTAAQKYAPGTQVAGKVVGFADFGAFVAVEPGLEGLVHVSEMSWTKRIKHPSHELKLGEEVKAVVLDLDAKTRRLGLGLRQLQQNPWTQLEEQYPLGTVIRSRVRSVTDFGVFVGVLEGIDGLVHISELSWTRRVQHPSELYKKGDEVEAVVIGIDVENERFSLSIKQAAADPWVVFQEAHPPGSRLKGKVTRVVDFGAFVELEPGIEGLVHVSELREERVDHPGDVVQAGEELEVMVLDVDPRDRKVGLSVRALTAGGGDDYRDYIDRPGGGASLGDVFGDKLKRK